MCSMIRAIATPGSEYYQLTKRKGVTRSLAQAEIRTRTTLIGAMLVRNGDADAMLCGTVGAYADHLRYVRNVIGLRAGRANVRGDAAADPAATGTSSSATPM